MSDTKKHLYCQTFAESNAIALVAVSIGAGQVASAQTPASELESEFLFELVLTLVSKSMPATPASRQSPAGPSVDQESKGQCIPEAPTGLHRYQVTPV